MRDQGRTAEEWYRTAAGAVFRRLRRDGGWSLREFGERVGIAHTSLYSVEREETTPSIDTLARVAEACGMTLPAIMALILDDLRVEGDNPTLASVVEAAASLTDQQRADVLCYIDYVRFRDRAKSANAVGDAEE